jgi:hypothetical protein
MRGRAVTGATHGTDRLNRAALSLFGLLLLGIGGYGLARGWSAFGDAAAAEPLLVGSWRDFVSRNENWFWPAGAGLSLLVGLLGLRWLRAQLAPASPDGVDLTHRGDGGTTVVRPAGAAQALANEIETYRGVTQASARLTGSPDAPEVDLRVEVTDECNVAELRTRIDDHALTHLEQALELEALNAKVEFRLTAG